MLRSRLLPLLLFLFAMSCQSIQIPQESAIVNYEVTEQTTFEAVEEAALEDVGLYIRIEGPPTEYVQDDPEEEPQEESDEDEVDPFTLFEWTMVVDRNLLAISGISPTQFDDVLARLGVIVVEMEPGFAFTLNHGRFIPALIYRIHGASSKVYKFLFSSSWVLWIDESDIEYI